MHFTPIRPAKKFTTEFFAQTSVLNTPLPASPPIRSDSATLVGSVTSTTTLDASHSLSDMFWENQQVSNTGGFEFDRTSWSAKTYHVTNAQPKRTVILTTNGTTPYAVSHSQSNSSGELAYRLRLPADGGPASGGMAIPQGATAAQGTDQHLAIVNTDTHELWELWKAVPPSPDDGIAPWTAQWGGYLPDHRLSTGIYDDLNLTAGASGAYQFKNWGGPASSISILGGTITKEEFDAIVNGALTVVPHMLHVVIPWPRWRYLSDGVTVDPSGFVWPARRTDGRNGGIVQEGQIFQLDPTIDVSTYSHPDGIVPTRIRQVIARTMQVYGFIITDRNGLSAPLAIRVEPPESLLPNDTTAFGTPGWKMFNPTYGTIWRPTQFRAIDPVALSANFS